MVIVAIVVSMRATRFLHEQRPCECSKDRSDCPSSMLEATSYSVILYLPSCSIARRHACHDIVPWEEDARGQET